MRSRVLEPLFAGLYSVPIILFLPLFILFFGLGPASKIAIGATISFFPITLNTIAGFGERRSPLRHRGALHGGVRLWLFRFVLLPAALPVILTGLRMGFTIALLSIIGSETLASLAGLGHRIVLARRVDGYGAHVRLHRFRDRDRGGPQRHRVDPRSAGEDGTDDAASPRRSSLALPGAASRAGAARRHRALFAVWEIAARCFVDPLFLSPHRRGVVPPRSDRCSAPPACRPRCGSPCSSSPSPSSIAVAIGLVLGLGIGLQPFVRRSLFPIVLLLYGMPQVTILPLFILYFGIGAASKIAFGVTHGVFPVMVTVVAGVQNLKPILLTSARSMGASRWQIFRHVIFPHMVPSFFAGMRLGMSGVLLGVLLAELYVSIAGIGYFTTLFTQNFDPAKLLGLVGMLAAMAIFLNALVRRAETHFGRWRTG